MVGRLRLPGGSLPFCSAKLGVFFGLTKFLWGVFAGVFDLWFWGGGYVVGCQYFWVRVPGVAGVGYFS